MLRQTCVRNMQCPMYIAPKHYKIYTLEVTTRIFLIPKFCPSSLLVYTLRYEEQQRFEHSLLTEQFRKINLSKQWRLRKKL